MMKFICKMVTTAAVVGLYLVLPVASAQEQQERTGRGLIVLYDFAEATGQTVHDRSGVGVPLELVIDKSTGVRWSKGVLSVGGKVDIVLARPFRDAVQCCAKRLCLLPPESALPRQRSRQLRCLAVRDRA